jgi:hypothetical protein
MNTLERIAWIIHEAWSLFVSSFFCVMLLLCVWVMQ